MVFEPFGPVKQVSVERACLAFYLDIALDGRSRMPAKRLPRCLTWRGKGPGIPLDCSPVLLFDPFGAFLGVFSGHLLPEHACEEIVAHRELLLGDDCAIVQCPAVNHWI